MDSTGVVIPAEQKAPASSGAFFLSRRHCAINNKTLGEALAYGTAVLFGTGLGAAFLITFAMLAIFLYRLDRESGIDTGFLGLITLLCTIFYLIGFSFLVAASVKGVDIKLAVIAVDALVLIGSKLLAPNFLRYLNDEKILPEAQPAASEA